MNRHCISALEIFTHSSTKTHVMFSSFLVQSTGWFLRILLRMIMEHVIVSTNPGRVSSASFDASGPGPCQLCEWHIFRPGIMKGRKKDHLILWNLKCNRKMKKGIEHMHWDQSMHLMLDKWCSHLNTIIICLKANYMVIAPRMELMTEVTKNWDENCSDPSIPVMQEAALLSSLSKMGIK